MSEDTSERYFAVAAPGLEPYTALELEGLAHQPGSQIRLDPEKVSQKPSGEGGVDFSGGPRDMMRANLHLRTASRVLVRLGEFYAAAFSELRKKAGRLPWEHYLRPGQPVQIRATTHQSRLYHSGAVEERIAGAIADRLGTAPELRKPGREDETAPPQLVVVRLVRDLCTLSVDSSGELLHRRGYRQATAKAPLRETLAAGLIMAAGWDPARPFLDPFCGSGTLPIEAARMAAGLAPGRDRSFAFMSWPNFDMEAWETLLEEADRQAQERRSFPPILGSDRDAGAIQISRANAGRAGVLEMIDFSQRAVSAIEPPDAPGWVVTNPPYGLRVSANKDLRNLYAQFGNVARNQLPGWEVAVLSQDERLLRHTGLPFERAILLTNGGVRVRLAIGKVPG